MASRVLIPTFLIGAALTGSTHAQWINQPKAGVPRTRDGKPNLSAPAPKAANGHPDLTGLWETDMAAPGEIERIAPGIGILAEPGDDPTTFIRYLHDVMADYKPGDVKLTPAAEKLSQNQSPSAANVCLPAGVPMADLFPIPRRFVQTPQLLVILYEGDIPRQIHMDGRALPVDPQPAWVGYSIAKWEGDMLVIQTAGFNSRAPLDFVGHPRSESMRMTERLRRRDFGHLDTQVTINDPTFYSKPITFRYGATLVPDDDLLESVCAENEKDDIHLKP